MEILADRQNDIVLFYKLIDRISITIIISISSFVELRKMRRKQRKTLETLMGLRSAESSAAKSSSYMRGSAGNSLMSRSATASLERPHELDLSIGNKEAIFFSKR